jgi:RimJ/RimL family protein N-acetyltransferase
MEIKKLETKNLKLIQCDTDILKEAIAGNENLAEKLGVTISEHWNEFGSAIFQYTIDKLAESEDENGWWIYFVIHKKDKRLIGGGGYKGKPTAEGTVEIGYEIAPAYRNRGFATEMTKGLIEHAFRYSNVKCILAHTLAYENPSTNVLTKCGFVKTGEVQDLEDGLVWRWELFK